MAVISKLFPQMSSMEMSWLLLRNFLPVLVFHGVLAFLFLSIFGFGLLSGWSVKRCKKKMNQVFHFCLSKVTCASMAVVRIVRCDNVLQRFCATVVEIRSTNPQSMQAWNVGPNTRAYIE